MSLPRIFISAPVEESIVEPWQAKLRAAIVEEIRQSGFEPQMFSSAGIPLDNGWNWSFDQVDQVLGRCRGAVIIALARHRFQAGGKEISFPTEYNHYEGGAAISHGLPILILAEDGVQQRGIADTGGGKFIVRIPRDAKVSW